MVVLWTTCLHGGWVNELDRALMALMGHVEGVATKAHQIILLKYVDLAKVYSQFQDEKKRPEQRKWWLEH